MVATRLGDHRDQRRADGLPRRAIPFLAGALLGLCRLYIQLRMTEPLAFEASTEAASADVVVRPSVWRILRTEKRAVLHISALSISGAVAFYTWFVFALSYAVAVHRADAQYSLVAGFWTPSRAISVDSGAAQGRAACNSTQSHRRRHSLHSGQEDFGQPAFVGRRQPGALSA
jgi:hypothetical protein